MAQMSYDEIDVHEYREVKILTSLDDIGNENGVNENGEKPNNELGQSLANVTDITSLRTGRRKIVNWD